MIAVPSTGGIAGPRARPVNFQAAYPVSGFVNLAAATNITPALPPGAAGQMMVALVSNGTGATISTPAGWVEIQNEISTSGTSRRMAMFCRVRQAGDAAPNFALGASVSVVAWIFGFTPSRGALALGASSKNTGASGATKTTAGITLTGTRNLLIVAAQRHEFWGGLHTSLQAANLTAGNPDGVGGQPSPFTVLTTRFENVFRQSRFTPDFAHQMFALADVPAGDTGLFSSTNSGVAWSMMAAGFTWTP